MTGAGADNKRQSDGQPPIETPVFVFGCCQRTGSTLVQRLLNSNGQMTIWGEHDGYLSELLNGYYRLMAWKKANSQSVEEFFSMSEQFFMPNAITGQHEIRQSFTNHIKGLFPIPLQRASAHRWGFKEVRYTAEVALFLQELFPGASFIHVVRRAEDCFRSMRELERTGDWQQSWTEEAMLNWIKINQSFLSASSQLNRYQLLRYEDLNGPHASAHVERLELFLGLDRGSLERSILKNHLDFRLPHETQYNLTEEERTLLEGGDFITLHNHYGY